MRKISLIFGAILAFVGLTALIASPENNRSSQNINFYQTDLICGAATDIGCGTRAKPILATFMEHEVVEEAWLNHAGTIIGVVWSGTVIDKEGIAKKVFDQYNQSFQELKGKDYEHQLSDFKKGKWYKGAEVDQLSIIEADRIASQLINWLESEIDITSDLKDKLHSEFEAYIKNEFMIIEDATVIDQTSYWLRWEKELTVLGKKHLGDKMPDVKIVPEEKRNQASCCSTDNSGSLTIKQGQNIPNFSLASLDNPNQLITPTTFRGKAFLIEFWATWCKGCVGQMEELHSVYAEYKDKGLEIISISVDNEAEAVQTFRKGKWSMPWLQAHLSKGIQRDEMLKLFEVTSLPKVILVDQKGKIIATDGQAKGINLRSNLAELFSNSSNKSAKSK